MHTQEDVTRFVFKVAPEGSLQGFRIPYTEGLISMKPCILWAKFLLEEREEVALSGPQIRTYMGQQPGALNSKRAMQPLPETGLGDGATFQRSIRMGNASWLPLDEIALTEDMLFSAAWSVQRRQFREQRSEVGSVLVEVARKLQPVQRQLRRCAAPHQPSFGTSPRCWPSPPCVWPCGRPTCCQQDYGKATTWPTPFLQVSLERSRKRSHQ